MVSAVLFDEGVSH